MPSESLNLYLKEFLKITEYLYMSKKGREHRGFLLVEKKILEALMEQNMYEKPNKKLRIWKVLHWIDAETGRVTKRIYDTEQKKYQPYIKIDLSVFRTLKDLY